MTPIACTIVTAAVLGLATAVTAQGEDESNNRATGSTPAAAPPATAGPERGQDLEELARRLDAAHRPKGPVPAVDSFRCDLELHLLDVRAEQGGQIDLAVQFLLWQRADSNKVRPLIRYAIRDQSQPIVRGRDRNGPWQLFQGEARDLNGAEFVQDLEQCTQHTNLARQLVRFLSPGDVLRALQQPGAVSETTLVQSSRLPPVPCYTVTGRLARFPLLRQAGEDAPVQLQIFVDKHSGRLLAVDVWPLAADQPDTKRGERILMFDIRESYGLLVPYRLDYLFRDENGELHLNSRVKLTTLDLRPTLTVDDFDRKRG